MRRWRSTVKSINAVLIDDCSNDKLQIFTCVLTPEHVSRAERWEFPLPAYMGVRSFAPSLKVIPDSSAQRPLSAHLKFHSLHARSNLKDGAIPDVAPIWPVCLLFKIFYKLHLSTNDLLEGTCESAWTVACPRLVESGIGAELSETEPSLWPLD